ncbi:ribulose-phosphate 3-epimerase [bacterium]|nr:ribulose-phosphate 3-epimerase [bacterium]
MSEIIISPSILSADFANLERDIKKVELAGADWLHIDVMDGHFVPNITIGIPVVKSIKKVSNIPLDVHLMIENPAKYAESFIQAGADILTFHYEAMKSENEILQLIELIKSLNCKAGMSIKPKTQPEKILPYLKELDLLLVMTVEPGFGGQKFMPDCAEKIPLIKKHSDENLIIQVDGGINEQTAKICKDDGASSLVAGNYIYKSENVQAAISSLR